MNTIPLHCIVCNIQFSTEKEVRQHQNLAGVCRELWNVFIKSLRLPRSSSWKEILEFSIESNQVPFCLKCRNLVTQLYLCHNKKTNNKNAASDKKNEVSQLVAQISASVIDTFKPDSCIVHDDHYDDATEEDKKISIMLKIMDLRRNICDNYKPKMALDLSTSTKPIVNDNAAAVRRPSTENTRDITTTNTKLMDHPQLDHRVGDVVIKTEIKSEPISSESIFHLEEEEHLNAFHIKKESAAAAAVLDGHDHDHNILTNMIETKQEQQLQCANCYSKFSTWKTYYSHCQTCEISDVTEGDDEEDVMSQDPLELNPQISDYYHTDHGQELNDHQHLSTSPVTTTCSSSRPSTTTLQSTKCTNCPGCAVIMRKPKAKKPKKQNLIIRTTTTDDSHTPMYVIITTTTAAAATPTTVVKKTKKHPTQLKRERDRRSNMSQLLHRLQDLVPSVKRVKNGSKVLILTKSTEFIENLKQCDLTLTRQKIALRHQNDNLRRQAVRLGILKSETDFVKPQLMERRVPDLYVQQTTTSLY